MIGKLNRATRPKGTFIDTIKSWQKEWFYITEPRSACEAAPPAFRSGSPHSPRVLDRKGPRMGGGRGGEGDHEEDLRSNGENRPHQHGSGDAASRPSPLPVPLRGRRHTISRRRSIRSRKSWLVSDIYYNVPLAGEDLYLLTEYGVLHV
ncbi:hypothetical protein ZWY2020_028448 [Hordeum vulgare]|nr:hypothetical protein ZWY2020_028448 [Hordeum vulgare]